MAESRLVVDHPRGSRHPRYAEIVYPTAYGYLDGTTSGDGAGIDIWLGAQTGATQDDLEPKPPVVGIICTVDLKKRDSEMKILLGCTPEEIEAILELLNRSVSLRAWLVARPGR